MSDAHCILQAAVTAGRCKCCGRHAAALRHKTFSPLSAAAAVLSLHDTEETETMVSGSTAHPTNPVLPVQQLTSQPHYNCAALPPNSSV